MLASSGVPHQILTYKCTWVKSWNCGCLVTWFCYQLIAKPGNKTAAPSWPHPHVHTDVLSFSNEVLQRSDGLEEISFLNWRLSLILFLTWIVIFLVLIKGVSSLGKVWGVMSSIFFTQTSSLHDDVIKWKHFPRYWPFVRGIHQSPVNSPHKGQWRGALMLSLICVWINGWVNNREAGDLRRYHAHYNVTVMIRLCIETFSASLAP